MRRAFTTGGSEDPFLPEILRAIRNSDEIDEESWVRYWRDNPINAWIGGNRPVGAHVWFRSDQDRFQAAFKVEAPVLDIFHDLVQEIVDYRLARYGESKNMEAVPAMEGRGEIVSFEHTDTPEQDGTRVLLFPNLRIACGHFLHGTTEEETHIWLPSSYGKLDPARHFIAAAKGNSMNGGKRPIHDGDYLLLELRDATHAGSITGQTLVIERQDEAGDNEYLLRVVKKAPDGTYILRATNPDYPDQPTDEETMRTLARLKAIVDPVDLGW